MIAALKNLSLALLFGLNIDHKEPLWAQVPNEWNAVVHRGVACPVCGWPMRCLTLVPHLNDDHHWTRERIADWVEGIEKQLEAEQAKTTTEPVEACA